MPAAPRIMYMRCIENGVENDYDGGLVQLQAIAGQPTAELVDARVTMSFAHDVPMYDYPATREEKRQACYRVTIEECTLADVPPDPKALPAVAP